MLTSEMVKKYGTSEGADVVGIAAASEFNGAPEGFLPTDVLPECHSVIVLGAASPKEVLNDIDEYTANRNAMLTNEKYGNLLWLSAILTDAELEPDEKAKFSICENCNKCVEICPVGALENLASFKRAECSRFFVIEDKIFKIKCFKCRAVCPHCSGI